MWLRELPGARVFEAPIPPASHHPCRGASDGVCTWEWSHQCLEACSLSPLSRLGSLAHVTDTVGLLKASLLRSAQEDHPEPLKGVWTSVSHGRSAPFVLLCALLSVGSPRHRNFWITGRISQILPEIWAKVIMIIHPDYLLLPGTINEMISLVIFEYYERKTEAGIK